MFDLKIKGKDAYNTLKRRFYYHLGRSNLSTKPWKTKSVLLIEDELEEEADVFFKKFEGFINVYKARVESIEEVTTTK
jgi:hypothetical protein